MVRGGAQGGRGGLRGGEIHLREGESNGRQEGKRGDIGAAQVKQRGLLETIVDTSVEPGDIKTKVDRFRPGPCRMFAKAF